MTLQKAILKAALPLTVIAGSAGLSGCATYNGPRYTDAPEICVFATNGGRGRNFDNVCAKGRQMIAVLNASASNPEELYIVEMIVATSIEEIGKTDPALAARVLSDVRKGVPTFDYDQALDNHRANGGAPLCVTVRMPTGFRAVCDVDSLYEAQQPRQQPLTPMLPNAPVGPT